MFDENNPKRLAQIALIAIFVAGRTKFGRQVYAVGGNERVTSLTALYDDTLNRLLAALKTP